MTAEEFVAEWSDGRGYVVAHTSGSTGTPKEIRLKKSDMTVSAEMTNRFFGIKPESRLMLCLSPDYIAGKMMIVRALTAKAGLLVETPSNRPLAGYGGGAIDLMAVVPSQALWLAERPELLRHVRTLIVGGGEIPPSLRKRLAATGVRAYATYGMTETCSHVALSRISDEEEPFLALPPTSFGTDGRGCLVIDAPQFSFRRLVTNDVVELLSPVSFRWKGRYDNVINTGGVKVFPEEVERKLLGVVEGRFYVGARPSEKWGWEVTLHLECDRMAEEEKTALLARLRPLLTTYEMPKAVLCEPAFEMTASGKIKRRMPGLARND